MKVRREKARKRPADLLPEIEGIQAEGTTSFSQIAAALNQRGIPAPRGGKWQAVQVQRVLKLVLRLTVLPAPQALSIALGFSFRS